MPNGPDPYDPPSTVEQGKSRMHEVPGRSMKGTTVKNRITAISHAATLTLALTACGGDKPAASNPAASAQSTSPAAPTPSASSTPVT